MKTWLLAGVAAAMMSGAAWAQGAPVKLSQGELDRFTADLGYRYTIQDNKPACPQGGNGCFLSEIEVRLPQTLPDDLAAGRFTLYASFVTRLLGIESDQFDLKFINGDLYTLTPKAGVKLQAGQTIKIKVWGEGQFYSAYYPMPNVYAVSGGLKAATIAATKPVIDPETGLESLPFVAPMTDEAKLATKHADDLTQWLTPERAFAQNAARTVVQAKPDIVILPTPTKVIWLKGAAVDLSAGVKLTLKGVDQAQVQVALDDLKYAGVMGFKSGPKVMVNVDAKSGVAPEGSGLRIENGAITITASDAAGAAYALTSLAQQAAHDKGKLKPVLIEDAPRLPFRGLHVDVARNFHSKAEMLKIIDQMAAYKLNKLHFHLGEDEGWRVEIKALPELATVGGTRCHDPNEDVCLLPQLGAGPDADTPVNGYYSQADYIEILNHAKARHIEVIPSFDMPGHSRAAVRSMEARYRRLMAEGKPDEASLYRLVEPEDTTVYDSIQHYNDNTLNVCIPATYRFLDTVIDEVAAMHAAAGVPLIKYHIGADETAGAWSKSPACQKLMAAEKLEAKQLSAYFIEKVSNRLAERGIEAAGWSDGMGHTDAARMPKAVQSNIWSGLFTGAAAEAHNHANRGWDVVISIPDTFYFDIPQSVDPMERGYDWPSRVTDTYEVFSFIPENIPANASWLKTIRHQPGKIEDATPLKAGLTFKGLQGQLWSETVRSDAQVDYMLFPRVLGLAERAWHKSAWEPAYKAGETYTYDDGKVDRVAQAKDWQTFRDKMPVHLAALEAAGVEYRIAPPGARIVGGKLEVNTEFAHPVEYRMAGGAWQSYTGPVAVMGVVEVRARTFDGKRAGRSSKVGE
ncbi:family 20 glycosylhydrolase [Asticcacaulis sp. ZE23SCel15]|uniref:family 20 glycosylhydrolase n=1 Tax=Asticcacaulis sp. ZE23SCel15 TaxID=3059027 RepID=UPI00265ECECD|nr:family 20 glycosylhydrolase [Asticcacaulis sp. ZE23SCel15]WKL56949.1 family 20 glycosylhydrolase [Asticcacaulis sp. ZE23SCel15]